MTGTLLCWLGRADLNAAGAQSDDLGPIASAVDSEQPGRVVLLCNYSASEGKAYQKWLSCRTGASIELRAVTMRDPTDYRRIYRYADAALKELTAARSASNVAREPLVVHLSPGTPAMQQVWVLLGMTRYPVRLIKSSREQGVTDAEIPFDLDFRYVDEDTLKKSDAHLEEKSEAHAPHDARFGDIVYRGSAMKQLVERAKLVSKRSVPVLIRGETGTGKELFARAIHDDGRAKKGGKMLAINCGAIPKDLVESTLFGHARGAFSGAVKDTKGAFEEADGGTLFLDELGEMPLAVQVKLLRALQQKVITRVGEHKERPVDVRIIAATHRDLNQAVRDGAFREDLFYRLAVAVLDLPPLRERHGDMNPLIDALLEKINRQLAADEVGFIKKKLAPKARTLLQNYDWPGNVRELENTLMRAAVWSTEPTLKEADLRAALLNDAPGSTSSAGILDRPMSQGFDIETVLDEVRRHFVKRALEESDGNKSQAARLLGLNSHQVLSNWAKRLEIDD